MEEAEILEIVSQHPLLGLLDAPLLERVVRASRAVSYRAGRTFHKAGEPATSVHFLLSGAVRVHLRVDEKRELLLEIFRAPALFGEMEVIAGRPLVAFISTLEPSLLLHLPAPVFLELRDHVPRFSNAVVTDLASRLWVSTNSLKASAFSDVPSRIAGLLGIYARAFGQEEDGGVRITVPLTQDAMARDLGVSRKAVVTALQDLKREGLLEKSEARYVINDMVALRARSEGA